MPRSSTPVSYTHLREYLDYMDERNPLLRYSYEDLFIVRLGYTYTYNLSLIHILIITKNLFLHVGYQLHDFKDPNNLMLGLGFRFNAKGR